MSKDKTRADVQERWQAPARPRTRQSDHTPVPSGALLPEWVANEMEAGKFFPETSTGLSDPIAPDDVKNVAPPVDGKIASVGRSEALALDAPKDPSGNPWKPHPATPGASMTIEWAYTMPHKTCQPYWQSRSRAHPAPTRQATPWTCLSARATTSFSPSGRSLTPPEPSTRSSTWNSQPDRQVAGRRDLPRRPVSLGCSWQLVHCITRLLGYFLSRR